MSGNNDLTLTIRLRADGTGLAGDFRGATTEVRQFGGALDQAATQSGRATEQTTRAAHGAREFSTQAKGASAASRELATETGGVAQRFSTLRNSLAGLGLGIVARDILVTISEAQNLNARIQGLTGSTMAYASAQEYLATTADRLHRDQVTLSESYARILALEQAGIVTREQGRQILEGMTDASAALGASSAQLGQTMFGMAQGFTAGVLRAEELNQVTEPLPGLLQRLDEASGLTAGGFRRMVNDGQVTSEFFKTTLIQALATYEGAAERTANNLGPRWAQVNNEYRRLKLELEAPVNASIGPALDLTASALQGVREHMDEVVTVAEIVAAVMVGKLAASLGTAAIAAGKKALADMAAAQEAMRLAEFDRAAAIAEIQMANAMGAGSVAAERKRAALARLSTAHAAYTVAASRATVATVATTASMGALRSVMAFLGGPVGIVLTAAAAVSLFALSSSDASAATEDWSAKLHQLQGDMKSVRVDELTREMDTTAKSIAAMQQEIVGKSGHEWYAYSQQLANANGYLNELRHRLTEAKQAQQASAGTAADATQTTAKQSQGLRDYLTTLRAQNATLGMTEHQTARYEAELRVTREAEKSLEEGHKDLAQQWRDSLPQVLALVDAYHEEKRTLAELDGMLDKAEKEQEEMERAYARRVASNADLVASLKDELRMAQLSDKERAIEINLRKLSGDATDEQRQQVRELTAAQYDLAQANRSVADTAEPIAQIYEDVASGIHDSFRDTFRDILDNSETSFEDLRDRLLDVFKDMLAEMAVLAITKPIIIPMVQSLGGWMGVSSDAQGQVIQQLGGLPGAATSYNRSMNYYGYAGVSGEQGAMLAAQTGEFGDEGTRATSDSASYGNGGGSYYGGMIAGAATGYMVGGAMYGNSNAAWGGAAGGAIGSYWGPVGSIVGSAIGAALADSFASQPGNAYGAIGTGSGVDSGRSLSAGALGAFGQVGWAEGANHVGGETKTPAYQAFFASLADLDDALAEFMDHDDVARVTAALDGWVSSSHHAFEDFGSMTRERLGVVISALDNELGTLMSTFQGSDSQAAEYALTLAQTFQQQQTLIAGLDDLMFVMRSSDEATAEFTVAMKNVNTQINEALQDLATTTEYTERVALEGELSQLIMQRYNLERAHLAEALAQTRALQTAAASIGETLLDIRYANQMPVETLLDMKSEWALLMQSAATETDPEKLVVLGQQMQELAGPLLQQAQDVWASGAEYQNILAMVQGGLAGVQNELLSAAPPEQQIVDALDSLQTQTVDLLSEIRDLLAIADYEAAVSAATSGATPYTPPPDPVPLGTLYPLAGSHADGLSWVPYDGYVAETHRGEAIMDAGTIAALRSYGIPVVSAGGGSDPQLIAALERVERAIAAQGGDLHIQVVTPDGRVLKEDTLREIQRRFDRREIVVRT